MLQEDVKLGYDGKRDRWNGYDPAEYGRIIDHHSKVEELKRENMKKAALEKRLAGN